MYENEQKAERALLVAVDTGEYDAEISMAELYELTRSAGAEPLGAMIQKRPSPESATCVGSGFLTEIADQCKALEIDLLIFDCELTPTQIRNIESETDVRTIDRTMLILDIFALRARSREGSLQVELAQLQYLLPRLSGKGTALSRLGGGIGTRGPGETKLETDRRHIRRRIDTIREKLADVEKHRGLLSARRKKDGVISVALVGYTNAGKSTLMNALTDAGVLAKDMLFATLDPTSRALRLPHGSNVMLIDTVGLVRRLPHHLVEAFKSTLEEAAGADLILNICDASSEETADHLRVTQELFEYLGCSSPILSVFNKCDLLGIENYPGTPERVYISAKTGQGIPTLLQRVEETLNLLPVQKKLILPFSESALAARIRRDCHVLSEEYTENGLVLEAELTPELQRAAQKFETE
ncbi:MAG: GTPase HflX [Clostridia bacterium]|nr:GTPase HflX [Clostridia bacterium]